MRLPLWLLRDLLTSSRHLLTERWCTSFYIEESPESRDLFAIC